MHKVFAPVEAIEVIEKVAAGLAPAHESGIVNRDVKPGNILFRRDGTPLLSDFGIAKRLSGDSDLTSTGMFVGSPNYMAPEQPESGPIDGRADIYSLGIILYEMLTGERAYAAESVIDVIMMHKNAPIPRLPAGLEHYQELLNLMLAKDRHERFRDARSLIHFIDQMRRAGVIRSKAQMTARPDIDVTGEIEVPTVEAPVVTRVSLAERKLTPARKLMLALLAVCLVGWGVLLAVEHRMQAADAPRVVAATVPATPVALAEAAPADTPQIAEALLWLGRHALDDFRLTDPPRDNAYYYFSRLQQIAPDNAAAREGMLEIANRYAILAEREIARDEYETARSYVGIGLQIDPTNESLRVLQDIAAAPAVGFWDALASLFK
jgi:serine/threonine-protein kinase PpkA